MFLRFKKFLQSLDKHAASKKKKASLDSSDPRVAALALIFSLIAIDGKEHEKEMAALENIVLKNYHLNEEDTITLIAAGRKAHQESIDIFAFTSTLNQHFNQQQAIEFIAALWEIAYADNHLYELEDNLIWRIAELLGVDRKDRLILKKEIAKNSNNPKD